MSNILSIPMVVNEMIGNENGISKSGDMNIVQMYIKSDAYKGFGVYVMCLYLHGISIAKEFYSREHILSKIKTLVLDPIAWMKEEDTIIKTIFKPSFEIAFPDEKSINIKNIIQENMNDIIIELEKYV